MLRAIDSVGESLRKSLESGDNIDQTQIVKANIAIEVKRVSRNQRVKFPDNIIASGDGSWMAQTKSYIELPSSALAGNTKLNLSWHGYRAILHTRTNILTGDFIICDNLFCLLYY